MAPVLELNGRRFDTGEPITLQIRDGRIAGWKPAFPKEEWPLLAPGLVDLQINGHGGIWFCDPALTVEGVLQILRAQWAYGVTRLLPTLITSSHEALMTGFTRIRQACEAEPWANDLVAGCHLEGPYISHLDGPRGAHPLEHVRPPDWSEFCKLQEASGGRIKLVTLAPETEGGIDFIRRASASGVNVAIGHMAASGEKIQEAVDAGARLSTHLGNGCHQLLPRHPNYLWDQLAEPRLTACLITDGFHVPPAFIKTVIRAKSTMRTVITCDASGLAGLPAGTYPHGSGRFTILPSRKIVVEGNESTLAGSGSNTADCVFHAVRIGATNFKSAWEMASRNPARALGLETARLARGCLGDVCLVQPPGSDCSGRVLATYSRGVLRYQAPDWSPPCDH